MSALLSGPGLASALPTTDCIERAEPDELKRIALKLFARSGLAKREVWKRWALVHPCGRTTVNGYLSAKAGDRVPPKRFVQWLLRAADLRSFELAQKSEIGAVR